MTRTASAAEFETEADGCRLKLVQTEGRNFDGARLESEGREENRIARQTRTRQQEQDNKTTRRQDDRTSKTAPVDLSIELLSEIKEVS
eukprot:525397-Hanusia_phi.AAC.1